MLQERSSTRSVVLFGLGDALGAELEKVLSQQKQTTFSLPFSTPAECLALIERLGPELVFCPAERKHYAALLEAVKQKWPGLPVVVVSRYPEVTEWLNAIEAGASDYCAPPFEPAHIQWILRAASRSQPHAA